MFYPNNIQKNFKKNISHKNRGMDLESSINLSNTYYLDTNQAVIYKKPTNIGIVDVKYINKTKLIEKAYFKTPSTLDYNGLYKGRYIEFEAKETHLKTAFPLSNIHPHQIKHLRLILEHGGIGFLLIKMNDLVYLLKGEDFINYIDNNNRKSIPYIYINKNGYLIKERINPCLDYLNIVNKVYFKGENYE